MFTKTIQAVAEGLKNLFDGKSGFLLPKTEEENKSYCLIDDDIEQKEEAARNLQFN